VLGRNALQDVRHVIALIYDFLQKFVELLAVDIGDRVNLARPELSPQSRKAGIERVVGFALDPADSLAQRKDGFVLLANGIKKRHDLLKDAGALNHSIRHRTHLRWKLADSVPLNAFRGVLNEIDRIIEVRLAATNTFLAN
jgi:hypothetical protein